MKKIIIKMGQFLKDVAPVIPTNIILFKVLTGIGATTLEIETRRHSIIMEANIPVIKGKKRKGLLCIYEGVTIDKVIEYMASKVEHKKILVTPESFFKVKEAAEFLKINLYKDYFFLYDECDRTIKDVNFRRKIVLPMDDFFAFENKAFVSATAIMPSDPRFKEQGFERLVIEPDFDYGKSIDLITTNNVYMSFAKVVEANPDNVFCIFFNSTNMIGAFVKKLNAVDTSNIYCSRESSYQLRANNFKHVTDHLTEHKIYNFFTSRFYSAVDIPMDVKPIVIMLTDIEAAPHSMIDPETESVQIVGRFRNGVKQIYHISNVSNSLHPKTIEEAKGYLQGCESTYNSFKALLKATTNQGSIDTLQEAIRMTTYANFVNNDGSKNYYMEDNFFLEEKIKMFYTSEAKLLEAYQIPHFKPTLLSESYPISDCPKLTSGISMLTVVDSVIESLNKVYDNSSPYTIDNRQTVLKELVKSLPDIVEGYHVLGVDGLRRNGYSKKQIRKAMKLQRKNEQKGNFNFISTLQNYLDDGTTYPTSELKGVLKSSIAGNGLTLRPEIKLLEDYFEMSKRKTIGKSKEGKEIKGFTIIRSKFNRPE